MTINVSISQTSVGAISVGMDMGVDGDIGVLGEPGVRGVAGVLGVANDAYDLRDTADGVFCTHTKFRFAAC